ncbi:hypothetical protein EYZ11_006043 [Aspergillus tanneri]|uniref:Uncharacterized protein n=1 Tax=Aspergillus tanneri TaxID=1220188 RepID=A0A4S3JIX6_9EURO|nr:hypothetical protein EYZ11_006043 [Aspergillus tanneri]
MIKSPQTLFAFKALASTGLSECLKSR